MKKLYFIGISLFLMLALISTLFVTSYADINYNVFSSQEQLAKYLKENRVPNDKQKILIEKVKNNTLWDCYNEDMISQVPKSFNEFDPQKGSQERYYRFEDGSFIKIEATLQQEVLIQNSQESRREIKAKIKSPAALEQALAISESIPSMQPFGTEHGTGYVRYYDWKIEKRVGTMYAYYYAEFFIVDDGPDSIVDSAYSPSASGFGELSSMPEFTYVRLSEDVIRSRYALMYSSWIVNYNLSTPWGGASLAGSTCYLYLAVGNNRFYVDNVLPY